MNTDLSRRDIRFLKVAYSIGEILAITPPYSFETETTRDNLIFSKIYGAFLACLTIASTIFTIYSYNREEPISDMYTSTHLVLSTINDILSILLVVSVIAGSWYNREKWVKLNNSFQHLDEIFKNRNKKEARIFYNVYFQFVTVHVLQGTLVAYYFYIYGHIRSTKNLTWILATTHINHEVCEYYNLYLNLLISNIALAFWCRYEDLNTLLMKSDKVQSIRQIEKMSSKLNEMVLWFNEIFGWCFIFIIAKNVIQILGCLSYFITDLKVNDGFVQRNMLYVHSAKALMTLALTILVMISCDLAKSESEKTYFICHRLQENLQDDSMERLELDRLGRHAVKCVAKFSAARFFEVDRSTLFGIIGTTTTYLIVSIQFDLTFEKRYTK